jgi:hypothetical protein
MKETPPQAMPPPEIIEKKPKSKKGGYRPGPGARSEVSAPRIAHLQESDDRYRCRGRNWMHADAQLAHDQRLQRLQAIQQELSKLADLGRRVRSVEQMKEQHRSRLHLVNKAQ